MPEETVVIELPRSATLVLYDAFATCEDRDEELWPADAIVSAAMTKLHAVLERTLVEIFRPDYSEQVEAARRVYL
jgi:hypothetical protein